MPIAGSVSIVRGKEATERMKMQSRIDQKRNDRRRNLWEFVTIFGGRQTYRDIARALGVKSLNTVASDLHALEDAGYIRRDHPGADCAITVVIPFIRRSHLT